MLSKVTYIFGMAVLGAGIGYFVTLSRSPVVAVLLPLLFGLIAGAGGFFLTREDLTQETGRERLAMLGICIMVLVGATILTSIGVFFVRGSTLTPELSAVPGYKTLEPREQLALVEMRLLATLLGASDKEKMQLLSTAAEKRPELSPDQPELVASKLNRVRTALLPAAQQLDNEFIDSNEDDEIKKELIETRALIEASAYLFHTWSSTNLANTSYDIVSRQIGMLEIALNSAVAPRGFISKKFLAFTRKPSALEALLSLKAVIQLSDFNLGSSRRTGSVASRNANWVSSMLHRERIELLKIMAGLPARDRPGFSDHSIAGALNR